MRRALLAALLLVAACGSDDEEAAVSTPGELTLAVEHDGLRAGELVTWRLTVTNGTGADVTLAFRSGQSGDVVLRADGEERYRWSEGMAFTEAIREEPLAAGDSATYELTGGPLAVPPGDYDLEATLVSDPAPPPVTDEVAVS